MDSSIPTPNLAPEIERLLGALRARIRAYALLEGIFAAILWLGLTFWAGLAVDYFPILVGASEMPRVARGMLLVAIALGLGYLVYRLILRRLFVSLENRSMALVLERRFKEFHDSLLTSVEFGESPNRAADYNRAMVARTEVSAREQLPQVRLGDVFNRGRLVLMGLAAAALVGSFIAFYAISAEACTLWTRRLYTLSDAPWPRRSKIEVVKVRASRGAGRESGIVDESDFVQGTVKVAKRAKVALYVRASADGYVPDVCTIVYASEDGVSGRVNMRKLGQVDKDNFQYYVYDGKPLDEIFASVSFDVVGYDHRIRDQHIEVVASPAIVEAEIACKFPDYLVDEKNSRFLPRTEPLVAGKHLPQGTHATLHLTSNKPLRDPPVIVDPARPEKDRRLDPARVRISGDDATLVEVDLGVVSKNVLWEVSLHDQDGVASEVPYRIILQADPDEPPKVDVVLRGVGSAITPDARLPFEGTITDDYGVAASWVDVALVDPAVRSATAMGESSVGDGGAKGEATTDPNPSVARQTGDRDGLLDEVAEELLEHLVGVIRARQYPFSLAPQGKVKASVDFREERSAAKRGIELKPKDKLSLTIRAVDRCTLTASPNLGSSRRTEIDVVTAPELIALLEEREVRMRRQFEQTIEELTATRDLLAKLKIGEKPPTGTPEKGAAAEKSKTADNPADSKPPVATGAAEPPVDAAAAAERLRNFHLLSVQRCRQQSSKSQQEVVGLAQQFEDICEEMINNRVDTEDRRLQLQERIAQPLRRIGTEMFPDLERKLSRLESQLDDPRLAPKSAQQSVDQATNILLQMEEILKQMLEVETYNQLVDLVREMIKDEDGLRQETNKLNVEKLLK